MKAMKKNVVVALVMEKLKIGRVLAETVADDLFRSDFPLNGITSYGSAIAYLDYVQSLRAARSARTN